MELNISKNTLKNALSTISHFTSSKFSTTPILQGILFLASHNSLSLTATNLTDFCTIKIPVRTLSEGKTVVESRALLDFLTLLESEEITISMKQGVFVIEKGKTKGNFLVYEAEDFPQTPTTNGREYVFSQDVLSKISTITFSSSRDEARPHLTGINFLSSGKILRAATTDGFRLSILDLNMQEECPNITVSTNTFSEVIKLSGESGVKMRLSSSSNTVKFELPNTTIYSQVIDGDFPSFEKVIPEGSTTRAVIKGDDFLKNIKIAAVFIRNQSSVMIFDLSKKGLVLRPKENEGKGSEAFVEMDSFEGESLKIAFNYRFVLEFLTHTKAQTVVVEANQSTSPCVFRVKELGSLLHIIMPLRTEETT